MGNTELTAKRRTIAAGIAACTLSLASCGADDGFEPVSISAAPLSPAPALGQWRLVWSDEFAGVEIDRANWAFDVDCWGGGNQEQQCYTDRPQNASVEDGKLVITARQEEFTAPALPLHLRSSAADNDASQTMPFTSARLATRGLASWKYGRIEVRAKLPQGQGTWPAIWMLPEDDVYGGWARSGEIDILEAVNLGVPCADCPTGQEDTILGTLHFGGAWPENALASTEVHFPAVLDGFHTFGVVWEEGQFTWTLDGQVFATKQADDWFTTSSTDPNAPFDQEFHLVLNLAIGGGLPEGRGVGGVSDEGYPKMMEIDWVRVWQCDAEPVSAQGCTMEVFDDG